MVKRITDEGKMCIRTTNPFFEKYIDLLKSLSKSATERVAKALGYHQKLYGEQKPIRFLVMPNLEELSLRKLLK